MQCLASFRFASPPHQVELPGAGCCGESESSPCSRTWAVLEENIRICQTERACYGTQQGSIAGSLSAQP